jgi:hypothetical protein
MVLDQKQSYFIRVESIQNSSIAAESGPVTILKRQSQAGPPEQSRSNGQ